MPASPYTTSDRVAFFHRNLIAKNPDFTTATALPKDNVDAFIAMVCDEVDMRFAAAGWIIPFEPLTGESWQAYQSGYLELLVVYGVSAMFAPALKPAPGYGPGRPGSSGNVFQDLYTDRLNQIYDYKLNRTTFRWRAKYRQDTPASRLMNDESYPKIDVIKNGLDFFRYQTMQEYTDMILTLKYDAEYLSTAADQLERFVVDNGLDNAPLQRP